MEINPDTNRAQIGELVSRALIAVLDDNMDETHDLLSALHSQLYPDATRTMTPAEHAAYLLGMAASSLHRAAVGIATLDHSDPVVATLNQDVQDALIIITDIASADQ